MSSKLFILEYDDERKTINISNYPYIDEYSAGFDIHSVKDREVFELLTSRLDKVIAQASKAAYERGMKDA